jgi:hypothetical protein
MAKVTRYWHTWRIDFDWNGESVHGKVVTRRWQIWRKIKRLKIRARQIVRWRWHS